MNGLDASQANYALADGSIVQGTDVVEQCYQLPLVMEAACLPRKATVLPPNTTR